MKTTQKKLNTLLLPLLLVATSISWSQSEAIYNISVTTTWNATDHTSVPGNAHWSDLIGATHSTADKFMAIGSLASTGIKDVAEFGSNGAITSEINTAINTDGDADQLLQQGFDVFGPISTAAISNITVSSDFPLVSLVSMVAPSPDWFIAVNSESLRSGNPAINNGWKDDYTIDVFVYDSGTDDGINYTSGNNASTPFAPITMATGTPTNGNAMATITFDYVSSTLSNDDFESVENVKVYPNPAKDVLNISNSASNLASAELYNVLGKRVNLLSATTLDNITINLRGLQSGVYILRLKNTDGDSSTRKVIIE